MEGSIEQQLPQRQNLHSKSAEMVVHLPKVTNIRYALAESVAEAKDIKRKNQLCENIECKTND